MYFQGTVAGVDQFGCRLHDRAQGGIELQPRADHQHGLQQAVESVAALYDLLDPVLDLDQQFPQPQLGQGLTERMQTGLNRLADSHQPSPRERFNSVANTAA